MGKTLEKVTKLLLIGGLAGIAVVGGMTIGSIGAQTEATPIDEIIVDYTGFTTMTLLTSSLVCTGINAYIEKRKGYQVQ